MPTENHDQGDLARKCSLTYGRINIATSRLQSELHESFTHWPFTRWRAELEAAGFVLELTRSKAYQNPWTIETQYRPTAALFREENGVLLPDAYPPTNVLLVARPAARDAEGDR